MMWSNPPTLFAKSVERVAVNHVKKIGRDIISSLADVSPIDTTQYTSNHNVSANNPDWSHSENKLLGERGAEAQNLSYLNGLAPNKLQSVWFTNATPYGDELEDGKSAQARTGVYNVVFSFTCQMYKS